MTTDPHSELIADAREDVPALIAEGRRLTAALGGARETTAPTVETRTEWGVRFGSGEVLPCPARATACILADRRRRIGDLAEVVTRTVTTTDWTLLEENARLPGAESDSVQDIDALTRDRNRCIQERDQASTAVQRVRGLHARRPWQATDFVAHEQTELPDQCHHCRVPYPCPTIRALAGRENQETT